MNCIYLPRPTIGRAYYSIFAGCCQVLAHPFMCRGPMPVSAHAFGVLAYNVAVCLHVISVMFERNDLVRGRIVTTIRECGYFSVAKKNRERATVRTAPVCRRRLVIDPSHV